MTNELHVVGAPTLREQLHMFYFILIKIVKMFKMGTELWVVPKSNSDFITFKSSFLNNKGPSSSKD